MKTTPGNNHQERTKSDKEGDGTEKKRKHIRMGRLDDIRGKRDRRPSKAMLFWQRRSGGIEEEERRPDKRVMR